MIKIILLLAILVELGQAICDSDCLTCNNSTSNCTSCGNNKVLYAGKCIGQCPETYYKNYQNECVSCTSPCRECTGAANYCVTCSQQLWFLYKGKCLQKCETNTIATYNEKQSYCEDCNANCSSCQGNSDNCTACSDSNKSLYLGTCINSCPSGSFSQEIINSNGTNTKIKVCSNCINNCQNCKNQTSCSQCFSGYFLSEDGSQCLEKCPSGFQSDIIYRRCYRTSCPDGMFDITFSDSFKLGVQCSSTCPSGYFIDSTNKKCLKCHASCNECTGPQESDCLVCHQSCLTCAGSRFDQCLSCTPDRKLYKKFNQPVGECVCNSETTEELKEVCENSEQSHQIEKALAGLTITNFALSVLTSFFTQNSILLLRYVDFSQTLSYLGYITFKYPLQMDRILKIYDHFNLGYLLPKPTYFADPVVISSVQLQNNPYDSQLEYKGNPLFFVNERLPFLIVNCFSYFIIYIICILFILSLRFIIYPITKSEKIKTLSKKLPHTLLLNVFILTSQEMITHTFIQFTNVQYKSGYAISVVSTAVAGLFTVMIFIALIYLMYRTKRKLDFEMEEEAYDLRSKFVRQMKEQNGIPSHFQLLIFLRKIIYSISVAFLYDYPKAQASIFMLLQLLLVFYFIFKQPFKQSKYHALALFIELSFFLFCLIMMISVFLDGEMLVNAFVAFGSFLILFQCIICLAGAFYFFMITFKLIKIKEVLELQELQKQYDAVKRLHYQDEQNQKNANFLFGQQSNENSPTKLLSNQQILADNGIQSNGMTYFNNQINNNNNTSYLGGHNTSYIHTKNNMANESQFLQNHSILETKTIEQQQSPIKGLSLGYLSYSGQDQSPIKKTNLRKLLPPINQGSELSHQNGGSNILSDQTQATSGLYKKSSIILSAVQQSNPQKNSDYIKKRVQNLKNSGNEGSPYNQNKEEENKNIYLSKDEIMEINSFVAGSIPNTSKVQVTARENENSSYRNNHALNNISSRSETITLQQKNQHKVQLIKDGEDHEDDEFENNNMYIMNKNSLSQKPHFISQNYQNSSNNQTNPKEITIIS